MLKKKTWLTLIAVPPLLIGVFVVGLFVYIAKAVKIGS